MTIQTISNVIGWLYVVSWGIVPYPQIFLNYKLKSVEGFQLDYPFLNLSGYIFYSISLSVAYFSSSLPFNNYGLGKIRPQDLVFAFHGVFISLIFNLQAIYYKRGNNRISKFAIIFTVLSWVTAIGYFLSSEVYNYHPASEDFNILKYLGMLKVGVTLYKYAPLAYWNYVRKSTTGFSIYSFLFDLTGGILSMLQTSIDYLDGTSPTINPIKLTLGFVTMCYDIILIYQHFFLYTSSRNSDKTHSLIEKLEFDSDETSAGSFYSERKITELEFSTISTKNYEDKDSPADDIEIDVEVLKDNSGLVKGFKFK